jgi:hypothetical protein
VLEREKMLNVRERERVLSENLECQMLNIRMIESAIDDTVGEY